MNLYSKIFLVGLFVIGVFLLTRKKETKFDKEYYQIINFEKYKVKGQY